MNYSQCVLIIDAGEKHLAFTVLMKESNEFAALEYYQLGSRMKEEDMKEVLSSNTLLQLDYAEILVFYNNANGILVPERFYDPEINHRMLELVTGDLLGGMPHHDEVEELNLHNLYQVPEWLQDLMVHHFPKATFTHLHSAILKKDAAAGVEDQLGLIFYPELIIASLWLGGKLQFMQCLPYETPEDITWHVLNICSQFDLNREQFPVRVSGLVEQHSLLYNAVANNLSNLSLADRPDAFNYDIAFDQYPAHFFSPLFSLALCAS